MLPRRRSGPPVCIVLASAALLAAGVTAAATGCAAEDTSPATGPARIRYGPGRQIAVLENKQIHESSGLACSRQNKDVFWTHNDSGDSARLFAFNMKGENLAVCSVRGAGSADWEDMCSFFVGGRSFLLIGDVGDNGKKRSYCTLYAVHEPRLDPERRNVRLTLKVTRAIKYRYAEGPVNCESVAVDPTTRTIYLVTKVRKLGKSCKVYALPWPKKTADKVFTISPIATIHNGITTAMDISPDGRRAVVLNYLGAKEYTRIGSQTWAQAFSRGGRDLAMPPRAQGESICYGPDGRTLYLTSEKTPTPLLEVAPVPRAKAPTTRPASQQDTGKGTK